MMKERPPELNLGVSQDRFDYGLINFCVSHGKALPTIIDLSMMHISYEKVKCVRWH
jgi:hypothetical protein